MNSDGAIVRSNSATFSRPTACLPLYQVNSGAGFPSAAHFNVTWLPTHEFTIDGEDFLVRIDARACNRKCFVIKVIVARFETAYVSSMFPCFPSFGNNVLKTFVVKASVKRGRKLTRVATLARVSPSTLINFQQL